jgi:ubiquitin C-terminal hydrolase
MQMQYCRLQALASLKPFYYHLQNMQKSGSYTLADALCRTINYVNGHEVAKKVESKIFSSFIPFLSGPSPGDPKMIMDLVAKHHSQFRSRNNLGISGTTEQQDAHEFLSALMDVLSTEERNAGQSKIKVQLTYRQDLMHSHTLGDAVDEHILKSQSEFLTNHHAKNQEIELEEEKKLDKKMHTYHKTRSTSPNREDGSPSNQKHHNPFDGWLGSTIKCATCFHIRPIRSSPFICLSLPIASVRSEYLEDFLASEYGGFSSVETVSDVQCVACAIKDKLTELEEEALLLSGAIYSVKRRNGKKDLAGLENELSCKNRHVAILKGLDADNDDEIKHHNEEDIPFSLAGIVGLPKIIPMRGDAHKATLILRPPKVLCMHVQRRHFDITSQQMIKISRRVYFPDILDLSKYCAYDVNASHSVEKHDMPKTAADVPKLPYRLMSVVEHKGSAFGGHYQTYRRATSKRQNKEWVLVSDECLLPKSWEEVRRCEAYMLFYEEMPPF